MSTEIKLVQVPIIQHKLIEVGANVTKRIEELNLSNLVATDETIKSLKELRAELNKEFTEFENQRKELKQAIANPYQEFENIYKLEISEKYTNAGEILKNKIGEFENRVKLEKKANIEAYFTELCQAENIDFLKFSHTGIEINLSTSEKKYKDECQAFVARIQDDIILIQGQEYAAEIMAEYKSSGFNASKAITTIQARKEAEKQEKDRIKAIETNRRVNLLRQKSFISHDMTKSYHWVNDEEISISIAEVENMSKDDFQKWFAGAEILMIEFENKNLQQSPVEQKPITVAKPVSAPVEVKKEPHTEKIYEASFSVTGTFSQLTALKNFLIENKYNYTKL